MNIDIDIEDESRPKIIASLVIYSVRASLPSRMFLLGDEEKTYRARKRMERK